jgi:hypothetical protein
MPPSAPAVSDFSAKTASRSRIPPVMAAEENFSARSSKSLCCKKFQPCFSPSIVCDEHHREIP